MVDVPQTNAPPVTGPFTPESLMLLHTALHFWRDQGFAYVDLPWMVPKVFSDATRPAACRDIPTLHGSFVASGEQSFLQLWEAGQLQSGAPGYVGWTPCLRDDVLDDTHQHGFMKVEWFVPLGAEPAPEWSARLHGLLTRQGELFVALAAQAGRPLAAPLWRCLIGTEQADLMVGDLEVGSYGRRFFNGRAYLYGTALAVPRFTQALAAA
jgi:hypothetical protein